MNNRQLRSWVFMLYPDNDKHKDAIIKLLVADNSLLIKHIEKKDDNGEVLNKAHYHCILKYDNPYWLSKVIQDLGLSDEDAHLFHSYRDFKRGGHNQFKTLDDYVLYLDHVDNDDKPDKYTIDDFLGGLKNWASEIIGNRDKEDYLKFADLCKFIKEYHLETFPESAHLTFIDWYKICIDKGFGRLFYKNWFKMRDVLRPYLNY